MEEQEPEMDPEVCADLLFINEEDQKGCEGLDEESRDLFLPFLRVSQTTPQMSSSAHIQSSLSALQSQDKEMDIVFTSAGEDSRDSSGPQPTTGSEWVQTPLKEMDDLLKSCGEMTGMSFSSHLSNRYTGTHLRSALNQNQSDMEKMNAMIGSHGKDILPSLTSYTDTYLDSSSAESRLNEMDTILDEGGATGPTAQPRLPPLTSAGCQLSGTMAEYQTELMGMLSMLEKCMEEAGMKFDPLEWTYPSLPTGFGHHNMDKWMKQKHTGGEIGDSLGMANHSTSQRVHPQNIVGEFGEHAESSMSEGLDSECCVDIKPFSGSTVGQFQPPGYQSLSTDEHMDGSRDSGQRHRGQHRLGQSFRDPGEHGLGQSFRDPGEHGLGQSFRDPGEHGLGQSFRDLREHGLGHSVRDPGEHGLGQSGRDPGEQGLGQSVRDPGEQGLGQSVRDPGEHRFGGSEEDPDACSMEGIQQETEMREVELTGSMQELEVLGRELEGYVEQVGMLEKRRDKLMEELQALREEKIGTDEGDEGDQEVQLMHTVNIDADRRREARMREWQSLRAERSEEEIKLFRVYLERQGLQEETRRLKRRLFSVTRECTQNQVLLATQQRGVAQLNKEQVELDALTIQLTEEVSQLRSNHQNHLSTLQSQFQAHTSSQTPIPMEEITQSKRNSCGDIQQYLQSGLKSLEEWYEPMLLALLKRREGTSEALGRARQQAQELRGRLEPLRSEEQKLGLQRTCLEERMKLIETQHREDIKTYKDTVDQLEETSREQRMELQFQKRTNKEMEELTESLTEEVNLYRTIIDSQKKNDLPDVKEKT